MIKYETTEAAVAKHAFESEAIYFCTDTGSVYFDAPFLKQRVVLGSDVMYVATEAARKAIASPVAGRMYVVGESQRVYAYNSNTWISVNKPTFTIPNVEVAGGMQTISNNKIIADDTATFYPDSEYVDLVSNIACTCSAGSVKVTLTSSYTVYGTIVVNG